MIDLCIRAVDHKQGILVAMAMGLLEILIDDDKKPLPPSSKFGVNIKILAPIVRVKPVLDKNGEVVTPAEFYPQSHYNVRITNPKIVKLAEAFIKDALKYGTEGEQHASEVAIEWKGVEIINPSTIKSPSNTWL